MATRWYRAPEIMLNWMHYNQTGDVSPYRGRCVGWDRGGQAQLAPGPGEGGGYGANSQGPWGGVCPVLEDRQGPGPSCKNRPYRGPAQ